MSYLTHSIHPKRPGVSKQKTWSFWGFGGVLRMFASKKKKNIFGTQRLVIEMHPMNRWAKHLQLVENPSCSDVRRLWRSSARLPSAPRNAPAPAPPMPSQQELRDGWDLGRGVRVFVFLGWTKVNLYKKIKGQFIGSLSWILYYLLIELFLWCQDVLNRFQVVCR